MIVYLVELEMDAALRGEYLAWLDEHARGMLALPGFTGAEILIRTEPPPPAGRFVVQAHYRLRDRAAWDGYLADHASRMRQAGLARFGQRVHASRSILESP
jgi:antibiotic biosynthesis monooxygenase (ABM) superfamily enzyme